jgi:uncharacterized protein YecT (DUF1311 family)
MELIETFYGVICSLPPARGNWLYHEGKSSRPGVAIRLKGQDRHMRARSIWLSPLIALCCLRASASLAADCADQTQAGLNQCAAASYARADDALNGAFKELQRRLKGDGAAGALLTKAQKNWIAFRDAECAFSSSGELGGSIYPMVYDQCLERVTVERTKRLQDYLHCEEGDLSCPAPARQ